MATLSLGADVIKSLETETKDTASKQLEQETYEVECPSCKVVFEAPEGISNCPACRQGINLVLDLFTL